MIDGFIINYLKRKKDKVKLENFLTILSEMKEKKVTCSAYPIWLSINPTNICNLKCPFCHIGAGTITRPRGMMPKENFKKIIDMLGPYLLHVDMCTNAGEPLLNKDVYQMISYAKSFNTHVMLSTNFQIFFDEKKAEEMINSKLDRLVISIDGASQETYEKYRRGGNFYKAIENIRTLIKKKKELKSSSPTIIWQFLVFRHNEHEIEIAQKMGKELGVDDVGISSAFIPVEVEENRNWVPLNSKYNKYDLNQKPKIITGSESFRKPGVAEKTCNWPWLGTAVQWDGTVAPCCGLVKEEDDFGHIFGQDHFSQLWNNDLYRNARDFIKKRGSDDSPIKQNIKNACVGCPLAGQANINIPPDFWTRG